MKATTLTLALPAVALGAIFRPDNRPLGDGGLDNLPIFYNLSTSVTQAQNASVDGASESWWTSSFLHGENNHDYYVVTHFLGAVGGGAAVSRASVLDLTTLGHSQIQNLSANSTIYNPVTGFAELGADGFSFVALNDTDPTAEFNFVTGVPGVHIDLTFEGSSPALVDGGLGYFQVGGEGSFEWSIPAGRTSGTLIVNGTTVDIVPERSITWFDREWGSGIPSKWHWFELHLTSEDPSELDVVCSAWVWDDPINGHKQSGTFRDTPGVMREVPVKSMETSRNWTSPTTNLTYELDYVLSFWDGSVFEISMVYPDQEFRSTGNGVVPGYDGYANVNGTYKGREVSGFAVVEIVYDSGE